MRKTKRIIFIIVSLLVILLFGILTSCGDSNKNEEELKEIESIFDHIANESELHNKTETETEAETESETETEYQEIIDKLQ